jgi:hypothetical protein
MQRNFSRNQETFKLPYISVTTWSVPWPKVSLSILILPSISVTIVLIALKTRIWCTQYKCTEILSNTHNLCFQKDLTSKHMCVVWTFSPKHFSKCFGFDVWTQVAKMYCKLFPCEPSFEKICYFKLWTYYLSYSIFNWPY